MIDEAAAGEARGLTFLQISDSHVGFDKPANPNASGRWKRRSPGSRRCRSSRLHDPHRRHQSFVEGGASSTTPIASSRRPGSTCTTSPASMTSSTRTGSSIASVTAGHQGRRLVQLRSNGVHFIGLVNVESQSRRPRQSRHRTARMARRGSKSGSASRRSWCSPTSHCGPFIRMGLGHRRRRPGTRAYSNALAR